jgi:hypothetical protein
MELILATLTVTVWKKYIQNDVARQGRRHLWDSNLRSELGCTRNPGFERSASGRAFYLILNFTGALKGDFVTVPPVETFTR